MAKKKLVVLTGAGISAESGVPTFRGSDGLWEGHKVEEVATFGAWQKNQELVLEFYNQRRKQMLGVSPNKGHLTLAQMEKDFDVTVITQNIDDLHERAGATNVVHLHGEILKARSTVDERLVYDIEGWELKKGDRCEKGSQLRPHIVWFGEMVPIMEVAASIASRADVFMVVGTSLVVYPAASLVDFVGEHVPIYVIDPYLPAMRAHPKLYTYAEAATTGVPKAYAHALANYLD